MKHPDFCHPFLPQNGNDVTQNATMHLRLHDDKNTVPAPKSFCSEIHKVKQNEINHNGNQE